MKYYPLLILLTGLLACNNSDCPTPILDDFEKGVGSLVENPNLKEASGLAASYTNPGMIWSHNDSGDVNRIFLMDSLGKGTKEFYLEGATNRDWEDMCISKFTDGNYIYVGDIGDNLAVYPSCAIYRVKEPNASSQAVQSSNSITLKDVQKITYVYPDGARDAECMFIDHDTKDIYILSKRDLKQRLYRLPYPQSYTQTITAEFVEEVTFSTALNTMFFITAGDVSTDNKEILIRNYGQVYHWRRADGESIAQALLRPAKLLDYTYSASDEAQGEGIAFSRTGSDYYTIGEATDYSLPVKLFRYARKK